MSTTPQERESEQVIGVVTGLVHKGEDRYVAVVQPDGSQYGKNLWTKNAAFVQTLNSQIGNRLAFACGVSHYTRQDGTPVRSLWINAIGAPEIGSPALQGPPQQQGFSSNLPPQQMTASTPGVRPAPGAVHRPDTTEAKIHRQTASKVAALLLAYMKEESQTLPDFFVLCERLVAYYNEGLHAPETLDELMKRAMPASVDQGPTYTDDDIPF